MNSKWVSAAVLLALLAAPGQARADTIVITSGSVGANWDQSLTGWEVIGENTRLHGENYGWSPEFDSGMVVNLSQGIGVEQQLCCPQPQVVGATTLYPVFLRGGMSFSTPTFIAPTAPNNTFRIFQVPFMMLGHIDGFATSDFSGTPTFSVYLTGHGTASLGPMRAIATETGTAWINRSGGLRFRFISQDPSPSPAPEPATLALIGSGFVVVAIGRRFASARENRNRDFTARN